MTVACVRNMLNIGVGCGLYVSHRRTEVHTILYKKEK